MEDTAVSPCGLEPEKMTMMMMMMMKMKMTVMMMMMMVVMMMMMVEMAPSKTMHFVRVPKPCVPCAFQSDALRARSKARPLLGKL